MIVLLDQLRQQPHRSPGLGARPRRSRWKRLRSSCRQSVAFSCKNSTNAADGHGRLPDAHDTDIRRSPGSPIGSTPRKLPKAEGTTDGGILDA